MFFETIAKFDTFQFFVGYLMYVLSRVCTEKNYNRVAGQTYSNHIKPITEVENLFEFGSRIPQ